LGARASCPRCAFSDSEGLWRPRQRIGFSNQDECGFLLLFGTALNTIVAFDVEKVLQYATVAGFGFPFVSLWLRVRIVLAVSPT
jgi:hypothetical protein